MRQFNFVIIFILCLAFGLFTIENTEIGTIYIAPGLQVQAPIAVELFLAVGLGAIFAWLFSIWTRLQRLIVYAQQVRQKNLQIKELEKKVEQYQAEVQSLQLALPPGGNSLKDEAQASAK
ncbi:MAG: LapA family protein [Stigonema ocellatum SAG 48.90 = DSM 106950]|nr:LapA family protein [Stigonema ocellatum SAG 48.90 = DSM 106950]